MDREADQVPTCGISIIAIMRSAAFAAGVDDVRNGRPHRYAAFDFSQDEDELETDKKVNGHWNYQRGRQWASLAPKSMPVKINGALNPKALALYNLAAKRGYVR